MADWAGIEQLHLSPSRPRGPLPEVSAAVQRLVEAHGPIDPVVVRPHGTRYEILSNAETWLAAQRAGWHEVPVDVRDDITDEDAEAILALTSAAGRSDPIEEARQLEAHLDRLCAGDRWRRHGAITRLARTLGKSRTHISHTLRLLKLPVAVQHLVARGELSAGHARALVTVKDARRQERLAESIIRQRLSVRETEAAAQGRRISRTRTARHPPDELTFNADPDVRRLETALSETLLGAPRGSTPREGVSSSTTEAISKFCRACSNGSAATRDDRVRPARAPRAIGTTRPPWRMDDAPAMFPIGAGHPSDPYGSPH